MNARIEDDDLPGIVEAFEGLEGIRAIEETVETKEIQTIKATVHENRVKAQPVGAAADDSWKKQIAAMLGAYDEDETETVNNKSKPDMGQPAPAETPLDRRKSARPDKKSTGSAPDGTWLKAFEFLGKKYTDSKALFHAITDSPESWKEGCNLLYNTYIETFFRPIDQDLTRYAQRMKNQYRTGDRNLGLVFFLKQLYRPGAIVWKGRRWNSLEDLAEQMMNTVSPKEDAELLKHKLVTDWLEHTEGISYGQKTKETVANIEALYGSQACLACYWFGFAFARKRNWRSATGKSQQIDSVEQVLNLFFGEGAKKQFYVPMADAKDYQPDLQSNGYDQLMSLTTGAKFYGVLCSFGYEQRIIKTFHSATKKTAAEKMQMLLVCMEEICEKEKANPAALQHFNLYYGPLGIGAYVCEIQKQKHIYQALTPVGKAILSIIEGADLPKPGGVVSTEHKMQKLTAAVEKLPTRMQNNPFLVQAGIRDADIVCTNLQGYFAWTLAGKQAPLGMLDRLRDTDTAGKRGG